MPDRRRTSTTIRRQAGSRSQKSSKFRFLSPVQILALRCAEAGIDPLAPLGRRLIYLVTELVGFPRHLSQHVGGMVMTQGPLCELLPIENAAMPGRTVIEWDKDDLDELGILKVDCLSLGMLTAIRKCFESDRASTHGRKLTLATVPPEDPEVYDMICQADTIGVFQIESRAQMSMLPRLQPREVLRPGDRSGHRPPRADPGEHGASVSAAPRGRGGGAAYPNDGNRRRAAARRSACRCFRSRRCGWPWSPPASRRARPISFAGRWGPGGGRASSTSFARS